MCHYLPFKLHKALRQNSKTLKVLHQRKSLGNPALGNLIFSVLVTFLRVGITRECDHRKSD
jgi:hypothetical protein